MSAARLSVVLGSVLACGLGMAPSAAARTDAGLGPLSAKCCTVSWDLWHPGNYALMGHFDHPGRMVDRFFMTAGGRVKEQGWKCSGNSIRRGASEIRASLEPKRFRAGRTYKVVLVSATKGKTYFTEARFKIPARLGQDDHSRVRSAHRRLDGDPRLRPSERGGQGPAGTAPPEPPSPRAGEIQWLGPDQVTVRSGEAITVELRYTGAQPLARGAGIWHTDGFGTYLLDGPCGEEVAYVPIEGLAPGATTSVRLPVNCPPGDGVFYLMALDQPEGEGVEISQVRRVRLNVVP
jgi:hypothetical protein